MINGQWLAIDPTRSGRFDSNDNFPCDHDIEKDRAKNTPSQLLLARSNRSQTLLEDFYAGRISIDEYISQVSEMYNWTDEIKEFAYNNLISAAAQQDQQ